MGFRLLCATIALMVPAIAVGSGCASLSGLQSGSDAGPDVADVRPQPEAAIDGGADATLTGWCGQNATSICDDFDEPARPTGWDTPVGDGGSLTITDAVSSSPPNSLSVVMTPADGGPPTAAYLHGTFRGGTSRVVCAMDVE